MARGEHAPRRLTPAGPRPPLVREFSAGGLVYRRRGGRAVVVLAARRHSASRALVWSIPKGHVERGESMREAALREVQEETGLRATIDAALGDVAYWYVRRDERNAAVRIFKRVRFFLMRYTAGRFADRDDEMDAVRWFPVEEAEAKAAFASERALIRRARELLAAGAPD